MLAVLHSGLNQRHCGGAVAHIEVGRVVQEDRVFEIRVQPQSEGRMGASSANVSHAVRAALPGILLY